MDEKNTEIKELSQVAATKAVVGTQAALAWTIQKCADGLVMYKRYAKRKAVHDRRAAQEREKQEAEAIVQDQLQREERHEVLMAILDDEFASINIPVSLIIASTPRSQKKSVLDRYAGQATPLNAGMGQALLNSGTSFKRGELGSAIRSGGNSTVSRPLFDFSDKEIGVLKVLSLMNSLMLVDNQHFGSICLSITYSGDNSLFESSWTEKPYIHDALQEIIKQKIGPSSKGMQRAITTIGQVRTYVAENHPELVAIIDKELKGSAGWLRADSL